METIKVFEANKWDIGNCFAYIAKEAGVKSGDEVAFLVAKGVDNSFAYRLGWDVRNNGYNMFVVPCENPSNSRKMVMVEPLSLQAGEKSIPNNAKIVVLLYGVHRQSQEKVKKTINEISKNPTIVALNLVPKAFEKAGWGISIPLDYTIDVEVNKTKTFDLTAGRKLVREYDGFRLMKAFTDIVESLKLKKGDEVVFIPGYGVCTVFAYRFAWELRNSGYVQYVTPGSNPDETRLIVDVEDIGLQADLTPNKPKGAKLVVLLTGLLKTFPYPEKVWKTIQNVVGEEFTIIAENIWPRAYEDAGWNKIIPISTTIDVEVTATKAYKIKR
jgi:hypothetical protein